jgi:diguanylate cyclase (GGDEF)-like protein
MSKQQAKFGNDPQENIVSILPATIAGMINLSMTVIAAFLLYPTSNETTRLALAFYGIAGNVYLGACFWFYNTLYNKTLYSWFNAILAGAALGLLSYFTPQELDYLVYTLVFTASLSSSIISDRGPAYLLIIIVTILNALYFFTANTLPISWLIHIGYIVVAVITVETIQQLKTLSKKQMNRLEVVNEISKQIVSTLETEQLISLLNAALHNALSADTYYIGIQNNDEIHLQLFYDDGEYFHDVNVKMEGTLSGWVINNQKPLFLPDLRKPVHLDGVNIVTIGKPKNSLSWMGLPMKGTHVNGVIAIASYRPNAFNRSDFELLSSIAQRAALALDNTYHHALVEEQARLDSLTRVYNHSYFIKTLHKQAETCRSLNQQLSLIMLDIDHFKQYNDSFGHLLGDEILVSICKVIRSHIKQNDAVGRWGGEEFAISLPNSNGPQANQVAQRIRETLAAFEFISEGNATIPVPTVSMGIAVFPAETEDVTKLIDLADKRLYIAKERGRDQVEPAPKA